MTLDSAPMFCRSFSQKLHAGGFLCDFSKVTLNSRPTPRQGVVIPLDHEPVRNIKPRIVFKDLGIASDGYFLEKIMGEIDYFVFLIWLKTFFPIDVNV